MAKLDQTAHTASSLPFTTATTMTMIMNNNNLSSELECNLLQLIVRLITLL